MIHTQTELNFSSPGHVMLCQLWPFAAPLCNGPSRKAQRHELTKLLESLLIARLLKAEDSLTEVLVRSMSFLVGTEEATILGS